MENVGPGWLARGGGVTDRGAPQGWLTEAHTVAGKEAGNGSEASIVGTKGSSLLS